MNIRRILPVVVAVIVVTPQIFAGGESEPGSDEVTEVRYAFWGAQRDIELTQFRIDAFNEQYDDIEMVSAHIPDPYEDKLITMIAAGTAPDVMQLFEVTAPVFAEQGTIIDILPYAENDAGFNLDDFFDNVIEMAWYDGGLYGLGSDFNPQILYYNKTLFDEAGLSYPDDTWTWDDYLAAARELTVVDDDNRTVQWGSDALPSWWVPTQIAIWQNGGRIFNDDRTESLFTDPEVVEAIQWQAGLVLEHGVAPSVAQQTDMGDMFATGRVAMARAGTWMIRPYQDIEDFEWDIAPFPSRATAATAIHTSYSSISSQSEVPDAAWEVVKHLVSPEMMTYMSENLRFLPQRRSVYEDQPFIVEGAPPESAGVLTEVIASGRMLPTAPNIKQITDLFQSELAAIYTGNKEVMEAMRDLKAEADRLLNE